MRADILMADIRNSSGQNARKLSQAFKRLVQEANNRFRSRLLSPLTITLGDEFQGIPDSFLTGIEIILYLEEQILHQGLSIQLRYVLLRGKIETPLNKKIAHGMMGAGLSAARAHLEVMKDQADRFWVQSGKPDRDHALNQALHIFQGIIDSWKPTDYTLVSTFLRLEDYKAVARKLKLNPSTTWRRRKTLRLSWYAASKDLMLFLAR